MSGTKKSGAQNRKRKINLENEDKKSSKLMERFYAVPVYQLCNYKFRKYCWSAAMHAKLLINT